MRLLLSLAWRNLWRNPRRTALSAGGVGAMVFLLVFALSMQMGSYDTMVDHATSVMHGHIQIQREAYVDQPRVRYVLDDAQAIAAAARESDAVRAVTVRATSSALASNNDTSFGALVVGVDVATEAAVSWLPGALGAGRYLSANSTSSEAVIGKTLARNLGLNLGDELVLLGVTPKDGMAVVVAEVVGLIDSGQPTLDRALVHIPLEAFQQAFDMTDTAHSVAVMFDSYTTAEDHLEALEQRVAGQSGAEDTPGGAVSIALWDELAPEIAGAIANDKASSSMMYAVLVLLATFSIANTFVMMLFERTREFGSLLAMGARPGTLRGTIALETFMLASIGAAVGAIAGATVSHYVGQHGISLGAEAENVLAQFQMPQRIHFGVFWPALFGSAALMILTTQIAAFIATRRVHRMQIVEAIREEM